MNEELPNAFLDLSHVCRLTKTIGGREIIENALKNTNEFIEKAEKDLDYFYRVQATLIQGLNEGSP